MLISEQEKNTNKKLAGLLNEDNSYKLKTKFGFDDSVVNKIKSINKKYVVFLSNILTKEYAKEKGIDINTHLKDVVDKIDQRDLLKFIDNKRGEIEYVLDWLASNRNDSDIKLSQIDTLEQAYKVSEEWHNSLEINPKNVLGAGKEEGKIIITYNDGHYWSDLGTNNSDKESKLMGHCGRDSSATTLFSYRYKGLPSVTVGYNANKKAITQVKGKHNERPIDKYMKRVYDLLMYLKKRGMLKTFIWAYSPNKGYDLYYSTIREFFKDDPDGLREYVSRESNNNIEKFFYGIKDKNAMAEEIATIQGENLNSEIFTKLLDVVDNKDKFISFVLNNNKIKLNGKIILFIMLNSENKYKVVNEIFKNKPSSLSENLVVYTIMEYLNDDEKIQFLTKMKAKGITLKVADIIYLIGFSDNVEETVNMLGNDVNELGEDNIKTIFNMKTGQEIEVLNAIDKFYNNKQIIKKLKNEFLGKLK